MHAYLDAGPDMIAFLEDNSEVAFRPYAYHPDYLATLPGATLSGRVLEPVPFDAIVLGKHFAKPAPAAARVHPVRRHDGRSHRHRASAQRGEIAEVPAVRGRPRIPLRPAPHALCPRRPPRDGQCAGRAPLPFAAPARRAGADVDAGRASHRPGRPHHRRQGDFARRNIHHHQPPRNGAGDRRHLPQSRAAGRTHAELAQRPLARGRRRHRRRRRSRAEGRRPSRQRARQQQLLVAHFAAQAPRRIDRRLPASGARPRQAGPDRRRSRRQALRQRIHQLPPVRGSHVRRPEGPARAILLPDLRRRLHRQIWARHGAPAPPQSAPAPSPTATSRAPTRIGGLAQALGIPADALEQTVARHNGFAATGVDEEFGKGSDAYQRNLGDASHKPNPCIGALAKPPFYAVKVYPGDIGASMGLVTNEHSPGVAPGRLASWPGSTPAATTWIRSWPASIPAPASRSAPP